MSMFKNIRKCVSRKNRVSRRCTKVLFNVKIGDSFNVPNVPSQIRDLLVYIAREGVAVTDLFRRPGNPQDMKKIISDLESGRKVNWTDYNFYTLANIAKRYLLHIQGGILGAEAEEQLLSTLNIPDDQARIEAMHRVIVVQSKPVQHLLALLFGIWFRMIYHTEVNAMSVEAVAKSVAGSVFPSCTTTPPKVERASKVMEYLITGFASADLFTRELIEYFTYETKTSISRLEKFKYEFKFPKDVSKEKSIRLFVRMLLDEGKKHGFHLIRDAVSKEIFEQTNWDDHVMCYDFRENQKLPDKVLLNSRGNNENVLLNTGPSLFPHQHPNAPVFTFDSSRLTSDNNGNAAGNGDGDDLGRRNGGCFDGGTIVHTRTSSITTPNLTKRANRASSFGPVPVQQTSEKRTCITATNATNIDLDVDCGLSANEAKAATDRRRLFTSNSNNNNNNAPVSMANPSGQLIQESGTFPQNRLPTCFSVVKRRQLERLQKRSDWFLSPPAGLRSVNNGLMHLEPNSSSQVNGVKRTKTMDPPVFDEDMELDVCAKPPQSTSTSSSNDHRPTMEFGRFQSPRLVTEGDLEMDIDRLALIHPEKVWQRTCPLPNASSSPNWTYPRSSVGAFEPDEKENCSFIETRYYVVERYYGPEPQSGATHLFTKESI